MCDINCLGVRFLIAANCRQKMKIVAKVTQAATKIMAINSIVIEWAKSTTEGIWVLQWWSVSFGGNSKFSVALVNNSGSLRVGEDSLVGTGGGSISHLFV